MENTIALKVKKFDSVVEINEWLGNHKNVGIRDIFFSIMPVSSKTWVRRGVIIYEEYNQPAGHVYQIQEEYRITFFKHSMSKEKFKERKQNQVPGMEIIYIDSISRSLFFLLQGLPLLFRKTAYVFLTKEPCTDDGPEQEGNK